MTNDTQTTVLRRLERMNAGPAYETAPPTPGQRQRQPAAGSPGWQMFVSLFFPGIYALRRRPLTGLMLLSVGVVAPIAFVAWVYINRGNLIGFALNQRFLILALTLGIVGVLSRFAAIMEVSTWFKRSPGIGAKTFVALIAASVFAAPVMFGMLKVNDARAAVAAVFSGGSSEPVYADPSTDPGVRNILLLGADDGPGRWGARTDTMILVSIGTTTGRAAMISIPRNLVNLRFPPDSPMGQRFPDGYQDGSGSLTNAIFTYVTGNADLMAAYEGRGMVPEAVALSQGIGYSLGTQIDDYALVNMNGFAQVIDAVGGVDITVDTKVLLPPVPGADIPESLDPGQYHMDGNLAIAYVRSRKQDSDYARTARQRQVLAALGTQVSPSEAAAGFAKVTGVLDDSMRTTLTSSEFSQLLITLGDNNSVGESIGLNPPLIKTGSPDYDKIETIVAAVQNYVVTGEPSGYA